MKKKTKKLFVTTIGIMMIFSFLMSPISSFASTSNLLKMDTDEDDEFTDITAMAQSRMTSSDVASHILNHTFYLKNAYSGRYLDVSGGVRANGTNIQQYEYNGTASQQWYINYNGDGTATLYSQLGGDFVLDVSGGSNTDGANIQLYEYNGTSSQKFKVYTSGRLAVLFPSTISNYEKVIEVSDSSCKNEGNVQQNTRDDDWNQQWLLEPVTRDFELGAYYAAQNSQVGNSDYSKYTAAYPKFSNDCTNFASQSLITSGFHYDGDWYIYRKNDTYNTPESNLQVNWSWDTTIPGPWMTANNFKSYLITKATKGYKAKGSDITSNPSYTWNLNLTVGSVVQIADADTGEAFHSMIITDYYNSGTTNTYLLSYHSTNTKNKSLLDICASYPDSYFLFYVF